MTARAPFGGKTFQAELDLERLASALDRVRALMRDQQWRSLGEIAAACQCSEAGASARLRDCRKSRHGGHMIERRRRGDPTHGLFEYRMVR